MLCLGAAVFLLCPPVARSQEQSKYDPNRPAELLAVDPEIRALLDEPRASCDQININDLIAKTENALKIADDGGLIRDRGLIEASLASAYRYQAKLDLAFTALTYSTGARNLNGTACAELPAYLRKSSRTSPQAIW